MDWGEGMEKSLPFCDLRRKRHTDKISNMYGVGVGGRGGALLSYFDKILNLTFQTSRKNENKKVSSYGSFQASLHGWSSF